MQNFLETLNYASDFICNLADKIKELQKLLKKNNKYEFFENHITLVKKIKEQCKNISFLILILPSNENNLILEIDVFEKVWSVVIKTKNNLLCRY